MQSLPLNNQFKYYNIMLLLPEGFCSSVKEYAVFVLNRIERCADLQNLISEKLGMKISSTCCCLFKSKMNLQKNCLLA